MNQQRDGTSWKEQSMRAESHRAGGLFAVYSLDADHFAVVGPSGTRIVVARDEIRRVVFQKPET